MVHPRYLDFTLANIDFTLANIAGDSHRRENLPRGRSGRRSSLHLLHQKLTSLIAVSTYYLEESQRVEFGFDELLYLGR